MKVAVLAGVSWIGSAIVLTTLWHQGADKGSHTVLENDIGLQCMSEPWVLPA